MIKKIKKLEVRERCGFPEYCQREYFPANKACSGDVADTMYFGLWRGGDEDDM